jgi:hypothetical protein
MVVMFQRSLRGELYVFKFEFLNHLADRQQHRFKFVGAFRGPFRCDVWLRDPRQDHQRSQISDFIRDIISPGLFQNAADRPRQAAIRGVV